MKKGVKRYIVSVRIKERHKKIERKRECERKGRERMIEREREMQWKTEKEIERKINACNLTEIFIFSWLAAVE